jgi:hypothetical protein
MKRILFSAEADITLSQQEFIDLVDEHAVTPEDQGQGDTNTYEYHIGEYNIEDSIPNLVPVNRAQFETFLEFYHGEHGAEVVKESSVRLFDGEIPVKYVALQVTESGATVTKHMGECSQDMGDGELLLFVGALKRIKQNGGLTSWLDTHEAGGEESDQQAE